MIWSKQNILAAVWGKWNRADKEVVTSENILIDPTSVGTVIKVLGQ